jgi:hypothetical protein
MWVPPELAQTSERYSVSGRLQAFRSKISFGPYSTSRAELGSWTGVDSSATLFNDQKERSSGRQAAEFELPTPSGVTFQGRCVQNRASELQHETTVVLDKRGGHVEDAVIGGQHRYSYECTIDRPGATTVKIAVEGSALPVVLARDPEIVLARVNHAQGADEEDRRAGSFGYLFKENDRFVAALDLSEHLESVTLRRDLSQLAKDELAAICTALLMRRDLR